MLISEKLAKAINQQVGNEFGASLEYVNIASYFESEDMLHFAQVFFDQADEERDHAMKFVRYLLETGAKVAIPAIPEPRSDYASAEDAVAAALSWEETVTEQINGLMDIAHEEKDYIAQDFLNWFVTEQLEEISKMSTILNIIRRAGDNLLLAETYVVDILAQMVAAEGG
ncbi:MAG: ferritin [Chloroflexi bacterium]|nr:MAG: ferritin [Chloroflexota bacterium]MBL1195669.1 ferritin [Chloroflexota bacterium]NOH12957.1 ferritin [Chloroflexota bacterium]